MKALKLIVVSDTQIIKNTLAITKKKKDGLHVNKELNIFYFSFILEGRGKREVRQPIKIGPKPSMWRRIEKTFESAIIPISVVICTTYTN